MKRTLYVMTFALLTMLSSTALAQDLGAVARQQREQKKPQAKKVFTNDDIATQRVSPAEPTAEATSATAPAAAGAKTEAAKPPAEDKAKATAALQQKIDSQKTEITSLTRELDLADRENRLRVANYYADAGNSLRDPKKWSDEQKAKQDEIDGKKKAIEAAKAKLADMIEQGRKAGLKVNE